jgi:SAM-dependent methyltransferase
LYLRIARDHCIVNHAQKIAAYRIHGNNMSAKIPLMLDQVLLVANRQQAHLRTDEEKKAFIEGQEIWKEYYSEKLYNLLMYHPDKKTEFPSYREAGVLIRNKPFGFVKMSLKKTRDALKTNLKEKLPDVLQKRLHKAGVFKTYTPKMGDISPGDFERTTPFSYDFGFDRGGAIDRFYIEDFLKSNEEYVKGRVLEIGDNEYTLKYGREKVAKSEILHIDKSNTKATYIGDITNVPQIASGQFDCIIFTQTLHLIYDFKSALATCYRILKPGGCLLLTVPGISHIDHGIWKDYWLWSFTDKSITRVLSETFLERCVDVRTYGNVYVAAAFLYGMGLPEFKKEFLVHHDPSYQVIISAKAIKS